MHTLILGAGYSGSFIAESAAHFGTVCGTRRNQSGLDELAARGIAGCRLDGKFSESFLEELQRTTHLVISVAPARELPLHDPMLELLKPLLADKEAFASLQWIGYLSTIGVYGDHAGGWVDEDTPCTSTQKRSLARREAELAWQKMGQTLKVPVSVLRLSGIYGPGRNAVVDAIAGRARMLIKQGQVFNRIHVEDLALVTMKAAHHRFSGVLNVTDNEPAPPQDVIRLAHQLLGKPEPEAQDFATAEISPMARSFYSENKRVRNERSKTQLGVDYRYPDYRSGLMSIHEALKEAPADVHRDVQGE